MFCFGWSGRKLGNRFRKHQYCSTLRGQKIQTHRKVEMRFSISSTLLKTFGLVTEFCFISFSPCVHINLPLVSVTMMLGGLGLTPRASDQRWRRPRVFIMN